MFGLEFKKAKNMGHIHAATVVLFLLLGWGTSQGQHTVLSSGGEASGAGGTASYSIGQTAYTTNKGTNGSSAQGVQQPYEIYIATGAEETSIHLSLSVYPNPTRDQLTLSVDAADPRDLNYVLFDLQGHRLNEGRVTQNTATLSLRELPSSTYILHVIDRQQTIKTFKIIKS